MKQIFTLVLFLSASVWVSAQLSVNPTTFEKTIKETEKGEFPITLSNITETPIRVYWKLIKGSTMPTEWETQVCDGNLCYGFNSDICSFKKPNPFGPKATSSGVWSLKVFPNKVKGSAKLYMEFYSDSLFTNKIGTTDPMAVFTADSVLDSKDVTPAASVSIYPNPTVNYFSIKNDDAVAKVSVVNIVGKEIWTKRHSEGTSYDVSDMAKGLYVVRLIDERGKLIKTIRLNKTSL